jgi:Right handed beta helix region
VSIKISQLPAGGAPNGTELVPAVQASQTVSLTTQQLSVLAANLAVPLAQGGIPAVDSGAANAYVLTSAHPLSLFQNQLVSFIPGHPNTGASTVNVNGSGVLPIVDSASNPLTGGELFGPVVICYAVTEWILLWGLPLANKRTAAEVAAGAVIVNYAYPPLHAWRYGADPTFTNDSTTALQTLANVLSQQQAQNYFPTTPYSIFQSKAYIPAGFYKISATINWHGCVSIVGDGITGFVGGTMIIQTTAGADTFIFHGGLSDHATCSFRISGICFSWPSNPPNNGYAIRVPKFDDNSPTTPLSSNSLYIEDCRFAAYGQCFIIDHGNDIRISRCIVDTNQPVTGEPFSFGNDQDASAVVTDLRIEACSFFQMQIDGIRIYHANGVVITGNDFFNFNGTTCCIRMAASTSIVVNSIVGVVIANNMFNNDSGLGISFDGSCKNILIADNVFNNFLDYPIQTQGTVNINDVTIQGNKFTASATYPHAALMQSPGCLLAHTTVEMNTVDCNGLTTLIKLLEEGAGPVSQFTTGCTVRDNHFWNNPSLLYPGNSDLKPMDAVGLEILNYYTQAAYPTSQSIFTLNAISAGASFTFDLDWEITINKSGTNTATMTGRDRISVVFWQSGGSLKSNITRISSIQDDLNGAGVIPTVTYAVSTASPSAIQITASSSIAAPLTNFVMLFRAHSFRADNKLNAGTIPQIKVA